MKAVVLRRTGRPEALVLEDLPTPDLGPQDVLIRVAASGVCAHDLAVRAGVLNKGVSIPLVPGHEVAGVVEAVGPLVRQFRRGDRVATTQRRYVCGVCRECRSGREATCEQRIFLGDWGLNGGYAEFVSVSEHNVANIPDSVAFADASVAACCIGTSLNAIRDVGQVFLGDRVLVTGASGGLGLHAVQIARAAGAFVVGATSALSKAQIIRDCGAHEVVVFERGADFSASVREACGGHGVDVAIDNIGGPGFHATRRSLRTNGRWILIGQVSRDFVSFSPAQFIHSGISLHPVASCSKTQLEDALALIVQARVRPAISKILPLADASTAHTMMEAGEVTGRLVLSPNPSLLNA